MKRRVLAIGIICCFIIGIFSSSVSAYSVSGSGTNIVVTNYSIISGNTYKIKNPQTGKFVCLDNDVNEVPGEGDILEQWPYGSYPHQWTFVDAGNGYYRIKCVEPDTDGNSLYMSVKNNSSSNNAEIILQKYSSADGQLWKVQSTSNGRYKIIPKCGEASGRVLCLNFSLLGYDSDGVNLKSKTYNENTEYIDEWYLIPDANPMMSQFDGSHMAVYANLDDGVDKIVRATAFVSNCYSGMFSLSLTHPRPMYVSTFFDAHVDSECTSDCGDQCTSHHHNIYKLSDEIYYDDRSDDHIYISWSEHPEDDICCGKENLFGEAQHVLNGVETLASVIKENGVIRPVICIYRTSDPEDEYLLESDRIVCASLILAHEMAHVYGMEEQYNAGGIHQYGNNYTCVMMKYDFTRASALKLSIENGERDALCNSCKNLLQKTLYATTINGNN